MRRPLVAGNWKMNGSKASVAELLTGLIAETSAVTAEVMVCPPAVFLGLAERTLEASAIAMGAQNVATHRAGAYTGEVSATMAAEFGCTYSLIGHSERRTYYGETDETVVAKFAACREGGLIPVVCIGETLAEREANRTAAVVRAQLGAVLKSVGGAGFEGAVVAYEPVWAIGTGVSASPDQAEEVHALIRDQLAGLDEALADGTRILYGGSVTAENAGSLFSRDNVDGALVGGASLKSADFGCICRAAG